MKKTKEPINLNRHHRRHLPHFEKENAVYYMTVCLKGSLPKKRIEELRNQRSEEENRLKNLDLDEANLKVAIQNLHELYFGKFDNLLDDAKEGPHWLKDDTIAQIWQAALFHFNEKRYKIICSTIMSNHVHFIFYKLTQTLGQVMKSLKGYSAYQANKALDRNDENFWQDESFDRFIRHRNDLRKRMLYIINNPVKARLVKDWRAWKWTYVRPEYEKFIL